MHFVTYSNWFHEDERGFCWCNRMRWMVTVTMVHASLGVILHFTVRKWDIRCNFLVCLWCSVAVLFQFRRFSVLYLHARQLVDYMDIFLFVFHFSVCFSFFFLFMFDAATELQMSVGRLSQFFVVVLNSYLLVKYRVSYHVTCILYIYKNDYTRMSWHEEKKTYKIPKWP